MDKFASSWFCLNPILSESDFVWIWFCLNSILSESDFVRILRCTSFISSLIPDEPHIKVLISDTNEIVAPHFPIWCNSPNSHFSARAYSSHSSSILPETKRQKGNWGQKCPSENERKWVHRKRVEQLNSCRGDEYLKSATTLPLLTRLSASWVGFSVEMD